MRVGSELKAARKKAGISVEVISKRTKISASKLIALEKNDFKNLPAGLYLFSLVRAYAREVHINPEPIVERLRVEFGDKDALDALQALNAAGALDGKKSADPKGSRDERSNLFRSAAIAAGVLLMAAAGAGAGVYLQKMNRNAHEVRSAEVEQSSVPLSSGAPAPAAAATADLPQPAEAVEVRAPEPTKTPRSKPRAATVIRRLQEPVAPVSAVSDASASSGAMQQVEVPIPERIEESTPALATAP